MFGIEADEHGGQEDHQEPSDSVSNLQLQLEVLPHTHVEMVLAWTLIRSLSPPGDVTSSRHVAIWLAQEFGGTRFTYLPAAKIAGATRRLTLFGDDPRKWTAALRLTNERERREDPLSWWRLSAETTNRLVFGVTAVEHDNPCAFTVGRLPELTNELFYFCALVIKHINAPTVSGH